MSRKTRRHTSLHGIRVLRFTNNQVLEHFDEVLNYILDAINS